MSWNSSPGVHNLQAKRYASPALCCQGVSGRDGGAVTRNDASHPNLGRLTEPHSGTSCPSLFRLSHPRRGPGIPAILLDFRPQRALSTLGRASCRSGQRGWVSSVGQVLAESQETCSLIPALLGFPKGQCPGQLSQVLDSLCRTRATSAPN